MTKTIEFFFDYISPYSYVAVPLIRKVAQDAETDIVYRPFFLGGVMKETGNRPPGTVPAKGRYLSQDLARCAKRAGLPLHFNPHFPMMDTRDLLAATIKISDCDTQSAFIDACFDAVWANPAGLDVSDWQQVGPTLEASGFTQSELTKYANDKPSRDQVRANTMEAVERGAFGAPSFFVGSELFFGHDRMDHILHALE